MRTGGPIENFLQPTNSQVFKIIIYEVLTSDGPLKTSLYKIII